ncbi:MAG: AraC family transcriptional regulator [Phocaeicola plebeius]|nr:AraC family transcriptional regulator [Phocaeicola plebeius]
MTINIKNMVCPRCITAVRAILVSMGFTVEKITLGEAVITDSLSKEQLIVLASHLQAEGFELLDDPRSCLVEQIKTGVLQWVRMNSPRPKLADYISDTVHRDYSSLSKLFSQVKGMTIEHFAILHRVEYAKELLSYSQHSVSEIAYTLGYSSPAYMTSQFKQQTGMSPKEFREMKTKNRLHLDEI